METILHKRRRVLISFSLPFLFFIIISVLILNIAIWLAARITENNERQNCISSLSEGSVKMDGRIRDIQNIVTLLRKDEPIYALDRLTRDIEAKDQYHVWLALQSMVKLDITRQGLDMLVYSKNADLVLSPNFMAGNMRNVWGSAFRFGEYDHAGFLAAFCVPSYRPVYFPDMELLWETFPLRGILYGMQLHIGRELFAFSLVREQQIEEYFSPVLNSGGALYMYDTSGDLLFARGGGLPPAELDTDSFTGSGLLPDGFLGPGIISAYFHSDTGLFYVSALQADTAFSHVRYLWNTALVLNIIAIVLSLGYALFLGAWNSRQIGEVFTLLNNTPGFPSYEKGNIMRYLSNSMSRLIRANTLLREDANSRQGILRIAFIDRLLTDEWESHDAITAGSEHIGIPITGRRFCSVFVIMQISGHYVGGGGGATHQQRRHGKPGMLYRGFWRHPCPPMKR